jgi:hypothetical protein
MKHYKYPKMLSLLVIAALVATALTATVSLASADATDGPAHAEMPDTTTLILTVVVVAATVGVSVYLIVKNRKKSKQ